MANFFDIGPRPLVEGTDYTHILAKAYDARSNKCVRGIYFLLYCHDPSFSSLYRIGSGRFKSRFLEHLKNARRLAIHDKVYIICVIVCDNLNQQIALEREMHSRVKEYRIDRYHLENMKNYHNEFFALPDDAYAALKRYAENWTFEPEN